MVGDPGTHDISKSLQTPGFPGAVSISSDLWRAEKNTHSPLLSIEPWLLNRDSNITVYYNPNITG